MFKDKVKTNVSIYLTIRNEAHRIKNCLSSFLWADEILVFDKNSDDGTQEIVKSMGIEIIPIPNNNEKNVAKNVSNYGTKKWLFFITASDIIHPDLACKIIQLTQNSSFNHDAIALPYKHYNFGVYMKSNPWDKNYKLSLINRDSFLGSDIIHREVVFNDKNIFKIKPSNDTTFLYHFTNPTSIDYLEKIVRYLEIEASCIDKLSLKEALIDIIKSIIVVTFKRKSLFKGWDGIAISSSYLSYWLLRYLYIWDKKRSSNGNYFGTKKYEELSNSLNLEVNKKKLHSNFSPLEKK